MRLARTKAFSRSANFSGMTIWSPSTTGKVPRLATGSSRPQYRSSAVLSSASRYRSVPLLSHYSFVDSSRLGTRLRPRNSLCGTRPLRSLVDGSSQELRCCRDTRPSGTSPGHLLVRSRPCCSTLRQRSSIQQHLRPG